MVMLKHSQLSHSSATQPRSLSFCPILSKYSSTRDFLNVILSNPFIIRLWKTFPTNQKLPCLPSRSLRIDDSVDCRLIILGDDWRGYTRFTSWELSRIVRGKRP